MEKAVPPAAADLYRANMPGPRPGDAAAAERMILARLRTMDAAAFARLPDCTEGLEYRFLRAVRSACSLEELLGQVKTKRYALSRLRRMALCAWLGVEAGDAVQNASVSAPFGLHGAGARSIGADARTGAAAGAGEECRCALPRRMRSGSFCWKRALGSFYGLLYPDLSSAKPGAEWRTGPVVVKALKKKKNFEVQSGGISGNCNHFVTIASLIYFLFCAEVPFYSRATLSLGGNHMKKIPILTTLAASLCCVRCPPAAERRRHR